MDKSTFVEKLFDLLREQLGEEVTITQRTIEKSNGISYEGFTIEKKTEYISPVISIDNCYEDYSAGISLDEIMKEIVHQYEESTRNNPFLSAQDIQNYEEIKDRIYMQVVNQEWNKKYLEHKYYVPFLDLAIVFYVDVQKNCNGILQHGGAAVTEELMNIWGIDADTIKEQAFKNLRRESIFQLIPIKNDEDPLLTFCDIYNKNQGALALIQKELLNTTKELLKESFYIFPVSLYDVMIVPVSLTDSVEEMKRQLLESNDELPEGYILSNNIYYYGEKEELEIAK